MSCGAAVRRTAPRRRQRRRSTTERPPRTRLPTRRGTAVSWLAAFRWVASVQVDQFTCSSCGPATAANIRVRSWQKADCLRQRERQGQRRPADGYLPKEDRGAPLVMAVGARMPVAAANVFYVVFADGSTAGGSSSNALAIAALIVSISTAGPSWPKTNWALRPGKSLSAAQQQQWAAAAPGRNSDTPGSCPRAPQPDSAIVHPLQNSSSSAN